MGFFHQSKNYYTILGADCTATLDQIKTAWRCKVKETHPDRVSSYREKVAATKRLQELNEAYEILSDIGKRREYDNLYQGNPQSRSSSPSQERRGREGSSRTTWSSIRPWLLPVFLLSLWLFVTFYIFFNMLPPTVQTSNALFGVLNVFGLFVAAAMFSFFLLIIIIVCYLVVPVLMVWLPWSLAWDEAKAKPSKEIIKDLVDNQKVLGIFLIIGGLGYFLLFHLPNKFSEPGWLEFLIKIIGSYFFLGLFVIPFVLIQIVSMVVYLVWARKILQKTEALMKLFD